MCSMLLAQLQRESTWGAYTARCAAGDPEENRPPQFTMNHFSSSGCARKRAVLLP
jgi:hypothetical protein